MGRLTLLVSSLLLLMLVAVACGGDGEDPDRVLLLEGGPITAAELLSAIRGEFGEDRDILNPLCSASFVSDESTVMQLVTVLQGGEEDTALEPSPADVTRTMEVVAEFCAYGLSQ